MHGLQQEVKCALIAGTGYRLDPAQVVQAADGAAQVVTDRSQLCADQSEHHQQSLLWEDHHVEPGRVAFKHVVFEGHVGLTQGVPSCLGSPDSGDAQVGQYLQLRRIQGADMGDDLFLLGGHGEEDDGIGVDLVSQLRED